MSEHTTQGADMTAYERATYTKLFCDISLFADWETAGFSSADFDRDLSLFLAGDPATLKGCGDFINEMLTAFDEGAADHAQLVKLSKRLKYYQEFISENATD